MVRITIYIDAEVALTLRQLTAVEGRSQDEIIGEAILAYAARSRQATAERCL